MADVKIRNHMTGETFNVDEKLFNFWYNKEKDKTIVYIYGTDIIAYELTGTWDEADIDEEFRTDWEVLPLEE